MGIMGKKQTRVNAKMEEGFLAVCVKAKDKSKTVYLNVSEFIASEFSIVNKGEKFALIMKCEEEKIEKEIVSFETKKEADAALSVVSSAIMEVKGKSKFVAILFSLIKWGAVAALAGWALMFVIGTVVNLSAAPATPEKAQAPKQGLQQEYLPEGKPIPLEDVVQ